MTPTIKLGTDGLRETVTEDTPLKVAALSAALVEFLDASELVLGYDTRSSSPLLARYAAEAASLAGASPYVIGECPTPGVAFLARQRNAPAVVVTASHNLADDNGIKFFDGGGRKLNDVVERELEMMANGWLERLGRPEEDDEWPTSTHGHAEYTQFVASLTKPLANYDGSVVVDCANGAMYKAAEAVLSPALGDRLTLVANAPDGANINLGCGATKPDFLVAEVAKVPGAIGFAFDGDGDRVQAVDENGSVLDGDFIITMLARDLHNRGRLADNTVVVSRWANLGLFEALESQGIRVVEAEVGDKEISELLLSNAWSLGGEQSGHVIMPDLLPTGDGLLVAVSLLNLVAQSGVPLAELATQAMTKQPQVSRVVRVGTFGPAIVSAIATGAETTARGIGPNARLALRASGTEPIVRVMCQDHDESVARAIVDRVVELVEAQLYAFESTT